MDLEMTIREIDQILFVIVNSSVCIAHCQWTIQHFVLFRHCQFVCLHCSLPVDNTTLRFVSSLSMCTASLVSMLCYCSRLPPFKWLTLLLVYQDVWA